jgi:protein-S-isoprenylcysteine O-methyltransferase
MASSSTPLVTSQPEIESASDTATSSGSDGKTGISWPLERPIHSGVFTQRIEEELRQKSDIAAAAIQGNPSSNSTIAYKDLLPGQKRSQSGIAVRSFALGLTFGTSILLYFYVAFDKQGRLWRPWFFLAVLSLFHFLEFWTHARYNLPNATISTFLLFTNGMAYNLAHTTAMIETILTSTIFPQWQSHVAYQWVQLLGFGLVIIGQIARTVAMVTATTNFHHHIQKKQREGHQLVKHGIYAFLRHPSYFGFFWWAIGTQLVLGNVFCFFIYVLVLWRFFFRRIKGMLTIYIQLDPIDTEP